MSVFPCYRQLKVEDAKRAIYRSYTQPPTIFTLLAVRSPDQLSLRALLAQS